MDIKTIKTLKEYIEFIEDNIPKSASKILWFRGSGKLNYNLSPSLHRHPSINTPEKIIDLEQSIMIRFNQRSVPFLNNPLDKRNEWEVLFFMQHYGVPTRLLDWSENPYIALYFALTSAVKENNIYTENICVWVLDPILWNRQVLSHLSYNGGILTIEDEQAKSYKPNTPISLIPSKPIAIFGTHNSPRIVAQRGAFTCFGKELSPMEDLFVKDKFPNESLRKIVIEKDDIDQILISLLSIGFTDSVVFPDLDGLSKEIKRFFDFKI